MTVFPGTFEVPFVLLRTHGPVFDNDQKEFFEYERALAVIGTRTQHALCIIKTSFGSSLDS
jgi:hypothetical protein